MFRGVLIRRTVTTERGSARLTRAEVDPSCPNLDALLTGMLPGMPHGLDARDVCTAVVGHIVSLRCPRLSRCRCGDSRLQQIDQRASRHPLGTGKSDGPFVAVEQGDDDLGEDASADRAKPMPAAVTAASRRM